LLYLNSKDITDIGINWIKTVEIIKKAVNVMNHSDFSQPIKPYLQFNDPDNRIIAMPAFAGGEFSVAGIKWIASFPKNLEVSIPRANSITILNDATTGVPFATINTPIVSGIRTASVSGLMIQEFDKVHNLNDVTLGIIGLGPIGQLHLQMATTLLGDKIKNIRLFDISEIDKNKIPVELREKVTICSSWEDVYRDADIFITCTVSSKGYIDGPPKPNALLLNVSLRDFKTDILDYSPVIVVDNWEEVCRANTDIEVMHNERNLQKSDTLDIKDIVCSNAFKEITEDKVVMFHPMGMATFDIVIAQYYYDQAIALGYGQPLEA